VTSELESSVITVMSHIVRAMCCHRIDCLLKQADGAVYQEIKDCAHVELSRQRNM